MSEFPGPETIESRNERIVTSIVGTISEILQKNGFFSVSVNDMKINNKYIFLEQELPNYLIPEVLEKYLTGTQISDGVTALENITDLRNRILERISSLFVVSDDFVGRFNKECQDIIKAMATNKS